MVFSKFLSNFKNLLTSSGNEKIKSTEHINEKAVGELKQGMNFLKNKQKTINKLQDRLKLIENMSVDERMARAQDKLTEVSDNEKGKLSNLEAKFNRQLSNYSRSYNNFMNTYYDSIDAVKNCKAACKQNIPRGSSAWSYKRQACDAGCTLKGPFVQSCRDTFKRSKIGNKDCAGITSGKCLDGDVLLGANDFVNSSSYADTNNILIKDGCCACGGGAGGPPTVKMRGKTIKKCEDIPKAFGYGGSDGNYMSAACHNARVNYRSPQRVANLRNVYEGLKVENAELIETAKVIFGKIKQLNSVKNNMGSRIGDIDSKLDTQMAEFGTLYADIMSRRGIEEKTVEAQLEDIRLKESSSTLRYLIWTGLAILSILIVIERMRK